MRAGRIVGAALALLPGSWAASAQSKPPAPGQPVQTYTGVVLSENADRISRFRFDGTTLSLEASVTTGLRPHSVDGPHGIAFAPDGRTFYVSIAHGTPYGSLWKYAASLDSVLGRVELGKYPATVSVTPDGGLAFVVNFNLQGEMLRSSVSVVATADMSEIASIPTCVMPHGSQISPDGTRHYSVCMMDDLLIEIDTRSFGITRHFLLSPGKEQGMRGPPGPHPGPQRHRGGPAADAREPSCSPTWAQPSADGTRVFVACNQANDIVEIDAGSWSMTRRIRAGDGVYNLAVTRDGTRVLGTNKRGKSVSVIEIPSGAERTQIATKRGVVHGIVVSGDDRYAFVSEEGLAAEPGTIEVIDLERLWIVASLDVPAQASGIALDPPKPPTTRPQSGPQAQEARGMGATRHRPE